MKTATCFTLLLFLATTPALSRSSLSFLDFLMKIGDEPEVAVDDDYEISVSDASLEEALRFLQEGKEVETFLDRLLNYKNKDLESMFDQTSKSRDIFLPDDLFDEEK